jgi:hypothetical protein
VRLLFGVFCSEHDNVEKLVLVAENFITKLNFSTAAVIARGSACIFKCNSVVV